MKILLINTTCGIGSTGRICTDIAQRYESEGNECIIAYGRGEVPDEFKQFSKKIGSNLSIYEHVLETRLFDLHGFGSKSETRELLEWANIYNPDLLWIHNIHGYYINIELLFDWVKSRPNMKVKWTLHDCWAFTGHCTYFSMKKCNQWMSKCNKCVQTSEYPKSFFIDNSSSNFERKRIAFTGVRNLTLITPSKWLRDLVKQSFLMEYPIEILNNTIDKNVFKHTPSDFRYKHALENKIVILGVANVWHERKGLRDFLELSKMLNDRYVIVLVGIRKDQLKHRSSKILCFERTNNLYELASIYSMADIYVNASREETFGMTTIEAIACGTFTIVYKDTACEEVVSLFGGISVEQNIHALYNAIIEHSIEVN